MPRHSEYMHKKTQVALAGMLMLVFDTRALERATKRPATTIRRWRDGKTRASVGDRGWMLRVLKQRLSQMLVYSEDTYDHLLARQLRLWVRRINKDIMPLGPHRHEDVRNALTGWLEDEGGSAPTSAVMDFMLSQGVNRRTVYNVSAKMPNIRKGDGVWRLKETK